MKLIEDGLKFENGYFTAVYPWIKDQNKLPDNKEAVHAMLKSMERRLMKDKSKSNGLSATDRRYGDTQGSTEAQHCRTKRIQRSSILRES